MLRFVLTAAVIVTACRQESPRTTTIAPAEPRPAPPVASTMVDERMITTTGSPPPRPAVAPAETATIRNREIVVRPLLPRVSTAFRIVNETPLAHDLVLSGGGTRLAVPIAPRSDAIVQLVLTAPVYEIVCTTAGHRERGRFETYRPGTTLE